MINSRLNYSAAAFAVLAIISVSLGYSTAFVVLKPLTTLIIICMAIVAITDQPPTETGVKLGRSRSRFEYLVVVALVACLIGDVMLLNDAYFVYGLASFLVAHLLLSYMFYDLAGRTIYYLPLVFLLLIGSAFYYVLSPYLAELKIAVAVYSSCILVMCWQGISVFLTRRDSIGRYLMWAALLFVFSDSMIAINKFVIAFQLADVLILSTYWLSIALIANVICNNLNALQQPQQR